MRRRWLVLLAPLVIAAAVLAATATGWPCPDLDRTDGRRPSPIPVDNCPFDPNRVKTDTDNDGIGNVCDPTPNGPDADSDGVPDSHRQLPSDCESRPRHDTDNDNIGERLRPHPERARRRRRRSPRQHRQLPSELEPRPRRHATRRQHRQRLRPPPRTDPTQTTTESQTAPTTLEPRAHRVPERHRQRQHRQRLRPHPDRPDADSDGVPDSHRQLPAHGLRNPRTVSGGHRRRRLGETSATERPTGDSDGDGDAKTPTTTCPNCVRLRTQPDDSTT